MVRDTLPSDILSTEKVIFRPRLICFYILKFPQALYTSTVI
jgi:hypothetical protein